MSDGRGATATATVPITVGSVRPVPTIETPTAGSLYRDGDTITFRGSATHPQDGTLPASALDWTIILIHIAHVHPVSDFHGVSTGSSRSAPTTTPTALRDHADGDRLLGKSHLVDDDVDQPGETVQVTLAASPTARRWPTYAGRSVTAPFTAQSAIGFARRRSPPATSSSPAARLWSFDHWSDNGAQLHDITIPTSAFTLTAVYKDAGPAADPALVAAYAFDEASGATVTRPLGPSEHGHDHRRDPHGRPQRLITLVQRHQQLGERP